MDKQQKNAPNALAIFIQARSFGTADIQLRQEGEGAPPVHFAYVCLTLSALAIELYVKSIICIKNGKLRHGHNLKNLFREISLDNRSRIKRAWKEHWLKVQPRWNAISRLTGLTGPSGDLEEALDRGANAFVAFRYAFEGSTPDFILGDLPRILDYVCLEIMPGWNSIHIRQPTPLGRIDPSVDGGPLSPGH